MPETYVTFENDSIKKISDAVNTRNAKIAAAARWYVECREAENRLEAQLLDILLPLKNRVALSGQLGPIITKRQEAYADLKAAVGGNENGIGQS